MTDDDPPTCPKCDVDGQLTGVGWVCPDCDRWLASADTQVK